MSQQKPPADLQLMLISEVVRCRRCDFEGSPDSNGGCSVCHSQDVQYPGDEDELNANDFTADQ